jgi:hypothetical protein
MGKGYTIFKIERPDVYPDHYDVHMAKLNDNDDTEYLLAECMFNINNVVFKIYTAHLDMDD